MVSELMHPGAWLVCTFWNFLQPPALASAQCYSYWFRGLYALSPVCLRGLGLVRSPGWANPRLQARWTALWRSPEQSLAFGVSCTFLLA